MPRNARHPESSDRQTLAELGLVSASVIHEVKNALQGIANALFLLEHDTTLRPGAREWISDAQRELSRAFAASRQTLALVRHESPSQVSVTQILDEMIETRSNNSANKRISVERPYNYKATIETNEGAISEV